jgi:4-methyl-5(b-hydroxyethyl)-thiazole monophosphate biosynthesis
MEKVLIAMSGGVDSSAAAHLILSSGYEAMGATMVVTNGLFGNSDKLSDDAPDMVILPGGMPGTKNLDACETVHKAISDAVKNDAYLCAICAAPMILGKLGLVRGKNAVCYPGFEEYLDGATIPNTKVVRDGKIITAKGMGAAVEFGLAIVSALKGDKMADDLASATISK